MPQNSLARETNFEHKLVKKCLLFSDRYSWGYITFWDALGRSGTPWDVLLTPWDELGSSGTPRDAKTRDFLGPGTPLQATALRTGPALIFRAWDNLMGSNDMY